MNTVQICNLALYPLGGTPISSLDEGSKEADLCKDLYPTMVLTVLSAHKWSFAKKEVSLAESSTYEMLDTRFEFAYQLPADYVRMSRPEKRGVIYERRGQYLATNESPFSIEYIASITDTILFPEMFAQAVAARLSVPMAQTLTRKGAPTWKDLYTIYLGVLSEAMLADTQDEKPELVDSVKHTTKTDSWIESRN